MIKIARQRGIDARLGCGERLPFGKSTFDYVVVIITLCFVKDPLKVLREARRVLKKNGKIIIAIIDKESFLGKFYQRKRSVFYKQAKFFSVKEIVYLVNKAGFKKPSYHQALFKMPDKIKAIERPKVGFGEGGFVVISARKNKSRRKLQS